MPSAWSFSLRPLSCRPTAWFDTTGMRSLFNWISCGRPKGDLHPGLGFGQHSTSEAAAYDSHVTAVWAKAVEKHFADTPTQEEVREKVQARFAGRVRRHVLRGADPLSARELRDSEDLDSTAGVRNPALLESRWPKLWG